MKYAIVGAGSRHQMYRDADDSATSTTLHIHGKPAEALAVWSGEGDHGGGDPVMLRYLLAPETMDTDKYARGSTEIDGAWSVLTGLAANRSIETGATVKVAEMLMEAGIRL